MPTVLVNLSTTEYVRVNTSLNPLLLQAHRDTVRITISTAKPTKSNTVFHTLGGDDAPLKLDSIDTNIWALATSDKSSLIVTETNTKPVDTGLQKTAFNELSTAELTPLVNVEFSYNLHPELVNTRENNGVASVDSNRLKLSTGAAANQSAQLFTRVPVKYFAGIGAMVRFSALFSAGVVGSTQLVGVGDSGDGFFVGFDGADFGILKRRGGIPEIRSIQVTVASTTAENITITLDGDADATVAVTNSGNITTTANEIAAHDYSNLGRGWKAIPNGDTVNFISYSSGPKTGVYSLSGATTAVGVSSQKLAGVSKSDEWVKQIDWNGDRFLQSTDPNNSPANVTLDPTKGNVFQIRYQWLGFGQIRFYIEHPEDGQLELIHSIDYANANTVPSINNPTLPICAIAENTTNDTDLIVYSSSMAGFAEGKVPEPVVKHVHIVDVTFISTTIVPVITLHNNGVYQNKLNRVRMKIASISVSVESGKPAIIQVIKDGILTDASFVEHSAGESVALFDIQATSIANGEVIDAHPVNSSSDIDTEESIPVEPTEFLTIAGAQSTTGVNTVAKVIVTWTEDF